MEQIPVKLHHFELIFVSRLSRAPRGGSIQSLAASANGAAADVEYCVNSYVHTLRAVLGNQSRDGRTSSWQGCGVRWEA